VVGFRRAELPAAACTFNHAYLDVAIDATRRSKELQAPPDLTRMIAHTHKSSAAAPPRPRLLLPPPPLASPSAAVGAADATPALPSADEIAAELCRRRGKIAPTARTFGIERTKFRRLMEKLGLRTSSQDDRDGEP
jgi:hypothetical protein